MIAAALVIVSQIATLFRDVAEGEANRRLYSGLGNAGSAAQRQRWAAAGVRNTQWEGQHLPEVVWLVIVRTNAHSCYKGRPRRFAR